MIEARHLYKSFAGIPVVEDLSFIAKKGETTILLGTSGSGKTTTLKMLNRLVDSDRGEVIINGRPSRSQPAHELRRGIGYVLQDTGLFPHLTVAQNIAIMPRLLGWKPAEIKGRTQDLLCHFGLDGDRIGQSFPGELSGGQRQRIGFVRALISSPPILLMDEPFGALDPITRQAVRKDFRTLDELKDKCIVMVTHDIQEAFELGDRIILLDRGQVKQIGSPTELLKSPGNVFVKNFLQTQSLHLQMLLLKLDDFLSFFPLTPGNSTALMGEISSTESFHEVFSVFFTHHADGWIAVKSSDGPLRYTTLRQLLDLVTL